MEGDYRESFATGGTQPLEGQDAARSMCFPAWGQASLV
jgi:hypothetical protein